MTLLEIAECVSAGISVSHAMCVAVRRHRLAKVRSCLHHHRPAACEGGQLSVPATEVVSQLVQQLQPEAVVHYQAADGSRLIAGRISTQPSRRDGQEENRLW